MEKTKLTREHAVLLQLLIDARHNAAMTQATLAAALGVPQQWVSTVEMGSRRIDVIELRRYCQALGVSFLALMHEMENRIESLEPEDG